MRTAGQVQVSGHLGRAFTGAFAGVEISDLRELKTLPAPALDLAPGIADDVRIEDLLRASVPESDIACTMNVTLSRVLEVKRRLGIAHTPSTAVTRVTQTQQIQTTTRAIASSSDRINPKALLLERVHDFQEVTDMAKQEYLSNPESESNYNAMTSFMKTTTALLKAVQDLDDPQDVAEKIVKQILSPYMANITRHFIDAVKKAMEDLEPTLANEYQTAQLRDCFNDALRGLREKMRTEYNRGVKTVEVVCEVKLDSLMMRPEPLATGVDALSTP